MNVKVYLSGGFTLKPKQQLDWLKRSGCRHRCYSYAFVDPGAFYYNKQMKELMEIDLKRGVGVMMDSSAHSFHNFAKSSKVRNSAKFNHLSIEKMRDEVVHGYANFIKRNKKTFDFYVNFDYVKHSPTIYQMQHTLQDLGIKPVPVFHGDDGFDWLHKYVDEGHKLIMVGIDLTFRHGFNAQKKYYDLVFNVLEKHKVKAHGLAVTGRLMFGYPWYSVDSTSWVRCAAYGQIVALSPANHYIQYVHISDKSSGHGSSSNKLSKSAIGHLKEFVAAQGFDYKLLCKSEYERMVYNAYCFSNIDKFKGKLALSRWESLL